MHSSSVLDTPEISALLFHPRREPRPVEGEDRVNIDVDLGETGVLGCRLFLAERSSPTILFFHGNGECVTDYEEIASHYRDNGLNLLVATYRGYGWSDGTPSASAMLADCARIFETVRATMDRMELVDCLFVMGRSLGSVSAIELGRSHPEAIKGLIVESGFAETFPLLERLGLASSLADQGEEVGFGNLAKIADIELPTLFLHGAADELIPIRQAEKLQAGSGARTKKFFVIPGADHNSVMLAGGMHYFATIKQFTDEVTGASDWRARRRKFKERRANDND